MARSSNTPASNSLTPAIRKALRGSKPRAGKATTTKHFTGGSRTTTKHFEGYGVPVPRDPLPGKGGPSKSFHAPGKTTTHHETGHAVGFLKGDNNARKGLWHDGISGNAKKVGGLKVRPAKKRKVKPTFGGRKDGRPATNGGRVLY